MDFSPSFYERDRYYPNNDVRGYSSPSGRMDYFPYTKDAIHPLSPRIQPFCEIHPNLSYSLTNESYLKGKGKKLQSRIPNGN